MLKHILPALAVVALSASSVAAQTATPRASRSSSGTARSPSRPSRRPCARSWRNGRSRGRSRSSAPTSWPARPVTLTLVDLPEKQALEIVMRGVPGYMAIDRVAQAEAAPAGPSRYDRVVVMARATTPVPAAATAASGASRGMPSPAQPPAAFQQTMPEPMPQAFAPPAGDDGTVAAGPDRNDVDQFQQQGEPPMPDAPVASPYPNAYPGSPYVGAAGSSRPVRRQPRGRRRGRHDRRAARDAVRLRQPAEVLRAAPAAAAGTAADVGPDRGADDRHADRHADGHHRPPADAAADRRPDGAGRAGAAGHRAGAAGGADAGPGRVLQPLQPPGRLGAAAGGAEQPGRRSNRIAPSTATRTTRRSRPSDAVRRLGRIRGARRLPPRSRSRLGLPPDLSRQARARPRLAERPARRHARPRCRLRRGRAGRGVRRTPGDRRRRRQLHIGPRPARIAAGAAVPGRPLRARPVSRRARAPRLRGSAEGARRAAPRAGAGRRAAGLGAEPRAPAVARPLPADRAPDSHGERGEAPGRPAAGGVPPPVRSRRLRRPGRARRLPDRADPHRLDPPQAGRSRLAAHRVDPPAAVAVAVVPGDRHAAPPR